MVFNFFTFNVDDDEDLPNNYPGYYPSSSSSSFSESSNDQACSGCIGMLSSAAPAPKDSSSASRPQPQPQSQRPRLIPGMLSSGASAQKDSSSASRPQPQRPRVIPGWLSGAAPATKVSSSAPRPQLQRRQVVPGYLESILSPTSILVSGRGCTHNGKISYGYASHPGRCTSMEDFYETRTDGVDGEIVGLFGVFDGHGGAGASEYVKLNLFSNLIRHPKFISDTKSAIADAYSHTDSEFLKSKTNQYSNAGSTATAAILVGDRLLVANVGDSRGVICKGGQAIAVSRDHKPDQTDERQRIEDAGGFVMWNGTWKVGGVLAVSRAFGCRLLKQYVVADPEIQEEKIDGPLEFLILATHGLWDVVTNEEAVSMIKAIQDPEAAAKMLIQEACQRDSADNITCVVVRFFSWSDQVDSSRSSST